MLATGLLKNEYLLERYFDLSNFYFWMSWFLLPIIFTYLIIWKLPKWVVLPAYTENEHNEADKKIIKISEQTRVEQKEVELQEEKAKKIAAIAKQAEESQKIKHIDPTREWENDYTKFKKIKFAYKFSKIIDSYYKNHGAITTYTDYGRKIDFDIPQDILAYSHSDGIIDIDQDNNKIIITEKGKYFIQRFLEDPITSDVF